MKHLTKNIFVTIVLIILSVISMGAQQWVNPHFDTHRMDYRDLGYPAQNLIEADNSMISALMAHSNGFVYGATSGKTQSYLFFYNRFINKVRPLGKIGHDNGVHHTLIEGKKGKIFIGTGKSIYEHVRLTKEFPIEIEGIEEQLWRDIKTHFEGYEGGHIFRYDPKKGDVQRYTNDDSAPLEDLGIPVEGNSIYAICLNADSTKIYGLSYPDANFFIFDIARKTTRNLGDIFTEKVYGGPERHWRSVPRAIYCHPGTGHIYTSGDNGFLLRYKPESDTLELTWMRLPGEFWEGLKSWDYPIVEQIVGTPDGRVFASTHDGYLVQVDVENEEITVLGKPRVMRRIRAMEVGKDGKLYMITGEFERSCKLHSFDLSGKEGFRELGPFSVDRSPYYSKRAYQFDAMAVGIDGTVFCGESDRGGKLFFYIPGDDKFKGGMNPTNPVVERQRKDTPALIQERL
jgi:hypothetical protein